MNKPTEQSDDRDNPVLRWLDRGVISLVQVMILLAEFRARDPRRHPDHLLKPDPREQTRIRTWRAVLEWSPQKRVGCSAGVIIGIAMGGAILWFGLRSSMSQ